MPILRHKTLFSAIQERLQEADNPLTCVDLLEDSRIRKFTTEANRVSDYLGHLWRRGEVERYAAPRTDTSSARYAYLWKKQGKKAKAERALATPPAKPLPPNTLYAKTNLTVEEANGVVVINLPYVVIRIEPK